MKWTMTRKMSEMEMNDKMNELDFGVPSHVPKFISFISYTYEINEMNFDI